MTGPRTARACAPHATAAPAFLAGLLPVSKVVVQSVWTTVPSSGSDSTVVSGPLVDSAISRPAATKCFSSVGSTTNGLRNAAPATPGGMALMSSPWLVVTYRCRPCALEYQTSGLLVASV